MTGIEEKTLYKRFERHRTKLGETQESDLQFNNVDNVDKNVEYVDEDVANNDVEFDNNEELVDNVEKQNVSGLGVGIIIGLAIVALLGVGYWLYEKWRSNKQKE